MGGPGGLIADFAAAFGGIDGILLGVALVVVLVILLIVYRSPILPFVVLLSAVFGLSAASLVVYLLAQERRDHPDGPDPGHPVHPRRRCRHRLRPAAGRRYREELRDQPSSWVAIKLAWRGSVEPIVASAATVILGLLCLLLSELGSTRVSARSGRIGIAGALLASLTFLPAILLLFGRRAFWPFAPARPRARRGRRRHQGALGPGRRPRRPAPAAHLGRHPRRAARRGGVRATFKADGVTTDRHCSSTRSSRSSASEVLGEHFPAGSAQPGADRRRPRPTRRRPSRSSPSDPASTSRRSSAAGRRRARAAPAAAEGGRRQGAGAGDDHWRPRTARPPRRPCSGCEPTSTPSAPRCWSVATPRSTSTCARRAGATCGLIIPVILLVIFVVLALLLRSLVAPLLLVARQRAVVRGDARRLGAGVQPRVRLPGSRPGDRRCTASSSWSRWASTTRSS